MLYVWLLVGLVVIVVVVLVALGRGDSAVPVEPDSRSAFLPDDRAVTPADVDALRLPQAVRGYRVADVDAVLDRLTAELRDRDALLAQARDDGAAVVPGAPHPDHGVELVVPLPVGAADVDPADVDPTAGDWAAGDWAGGDRFGEHPDPEPDADPDPGDDRGGAVAGTGSPA